MRKYWTVIAAITLFVYQGCVNSGVKYVAPTFKSVSTAKFQLLTGEQMWGGVSSIYKYNDLLAVAMYDFNKPSTSLHFFSTDGNHLLDMIYDGRGPFEILSTPRTYMRDSTLYMLDIIGQKMLTVNMNRVVEEAYGACQSEDCTAGFLCIYAEKLENGDMLCFFRPDMDGGIRIKLTSEGKSSSYVLSPYADMSAMERGYLEFYTSMQTVAPDGKHFAMAIGNGAVLETFAVNDGEVSEVSKKYFVEPKYDMTATSIGTNVQSIAGFGYLYGTNDRIYSVYDGENTYKDKAKMLFKNIAVFDWKGNALKEIRTDYRISSLYTDDGKEFYAVVEDKDRRPYVARLVVE